MDNSGTSSHTSHAPARKNNKNLFIIVIAALLLIGIASYVMMQRSGDETVDESTAIQSTGEVDGDEISYDLYAMEGGYTGALWLSEEDGKTTAYLEVYDAPEGAVLPAHMYYGTCDSDEGVIFDLEPVVDGVSESVLVTDMASLMKEYPLSVAVQKSASEPDTYVSCGDLQ